DGRYPQAARLFEQIYRDTGNLVALYNAGICRHAAGAGHEAHALYDWARYLALAPSVTSDERADIDNRRARPLELTTPVELRYDYPPASPDPTRIELHRGARDPDPLIVDLAPNQRTLELRLGVGAWTARVLGPDGLLHSQPFNITRPAGDLLTLRMVPAAPDPTAISIHLGPGRALTRGIELTWEGPDSPPPTETLTDPDRPWYLPPGPWVLHARAPGFRPESRLIHVDRTPTELDLTLRRHPGSTARIALSLTTGLAAVGLGIGGGILWSQGNQAYQDHLPGLTTTDLDARHEAIDTLRAARRTEAQGVGLLLGGVGAGIATITEASGGGKRALLAEFGLGTAMAAGGTLGSILYRHDNPLYSLSPQADLTDRRRAIDSLHGLIGAGAGLAGAALIAVITHAAIDSRLKRRPTPNLALRGATLHF
ncbi:MAG TPA: hypothetical protein PKW35_04560, partial [Nannocystaceae bacterium]|nr:hypothetical protein [Nannocystaceae bacterium]